MEKKTRFYVSNRNVLTWLMALCMIGSAVARIYLFSGSEGTGAWSQIFLPIAAAMLFAAITLISGDELLYKTAIPVWMVTVYAGIWVNGNMHGRTMYGDSLDAVLLTMIPYDIQGFGCNCSIGPDVIMRALKPAAPIAKRYGIPLIAKPNAGMPVTDETGTHFQLTPADMAAAVEEFVGMGVGVFGGCCGTAPEYIRALKDNL